MNHWLFQGNPKYYRIKEAIQAFETMPWLVTRYAKEMQVGDGVLVWIAGADAGIYAISEIIELPQVLETIPDAEYWTNPVFMNHLKFLIRKKVQSKTTVEKTLRMPRVKIF